MAVQYWIGGFFVDSSRNQITQNKQSQTITPKALAVLNYLAENQRKVVSHEALLAKVWQDTVVSPNTLQRNIAQLRKALGDDGKVQVYIKTHAKQGYSLECDVRWHDNSDSTEPHSSPENVVEEPHVSEINSDTRTANKPKPSIGALRQTLIAAGMIILAIIGTMYLTSKQIPPLTFDKLRSLTATDDKEFNASYTPDGKYIIFHRYLDKQCINKLWAKNISTQKETQLTKEWGAYGRHSFSKDGKKLVFLATKACNEPVSQKRCYNLVSLDFAKALESPKQPSLILQCQNSQVMNPIWLNNNDVALLQKNSDRWKLISYSISKNKSTDLYELKSGNLIDFAYSVRDDLIAVISIHNDDQQYIEMIKPDGQVLSSHLIEHPPELSKSHPIYPKFDPLNKQLIFSTGRQLFTLSYDGKVDKISFPFSESMVGPEFHPDGKRLLMIRGPNDSDIALLPLRKITEASPLTQNKQTQLKQPQSYSSFERSTREEGGAIFQPGGELIAFWSERSGEHQLWISDGTGPQQLSSFPIDTYMTGFYWAADGNSLLVNADGVLTQVFLDSSQKSFPMEHPIVKFFQWDSKNNTALLTLRIKGVLKFVQYNLNNSEIKEITDKKVKWAFKSEDGRLIYKDYMDQFWQPGPAEAQRIKVLDKNAGNGKTFVIKDNVIFAINNENQLWSYDLDNDVFKILGEITKGVVGHLTDINKTQFLMTVVVSAKTEVVELSLSE